MGKKLGFVENRRKAVYDFIMLAGRIKSFIKLFAPNSALGGYHFVLARIGALLAGSPSSKIYVIGVTGTSGKSTTVSIISHLLDSCGISSGYITTIGFKIGKDFRLNDRKMTMLGRFQTQAMLRRMVRSALKCAIIETTSQGIEQFRHKGVNYDMVLVTNLHPEHLEAHGSFEAYKNAKLKLLKHVYDSPHKIMDGKLVPKIVIVNADDPHAEDFLRLNKDRSVSFSFEGKTLAKESVLVNSLELSGSGSDFEIEGIEFHSPLLGMHNAYNAAAALVAVHALGIGWAPLAGALKNLGSIPGRLEFIREGQNFNVVVDYAFEPVAMEKLYDAIGVISHQRVIHVFGGTGGGRDVRRRPVLGKFVARMADIAIITNEDPYDEDPLSIMKDVENGVKESGTKTEGKTYFMIADRREAIKKAIDSAQEGDLVLITGKGSEQAIAGSYGSLIKWDDREIVREILKSEVQIGNSKI